MSAATRPPHASIESKHSIPTSGVPPHTVSKHRNLETGTLQQESHMGASKLTHSFFNTGEYRATQGLAGSPLSAHTPGAGEVHSERTLGPHQCKHIIEKKWPASTGEAAGVAPTHTAIYDLVKGHNLPNYIGARVSIPSALIIKEWRSLLRGYKDEKICDFLEFGWPISYTSENLPTPTWFNHKSATDYHEHVTQFLEKECRLGAMLGPFQKPPFQPWVQVSPMLTRPKKEGDKRRVIIDLSFPDGAGVNAGILKNMYEGEPLQYTLPTVLDMCTEIARAGRGCWLWKCDLERAYRQLRIDPLAYPLLGVHHGGAYYIDICPSFGCRVSGSSQQRVSQALCHLLRQRGHTILAYVDDFGGIHKTREGAEAGFGMFHSLCTRLGLSLAKDKSASPSTEMEWLGFRFDTQDLSVTIPEKKLEEVLLETERWVEKRTADRRELQSLAGKLAHISTCIRHARKFMSRVLAQLRSTPLATRWLVGEELRKDVAWFNKCARNLNRKLIIPEVRPVFEIECDASLAGGGGFSHDQFYDLVFPMSVSERCHISQLEALNIVVAVKTLVPKDLKGHMVVIKTDNSASASVLVTGRTRDGVMAACSRELAMVVVTQQLEVDVRHVPGVSLVLADALSRRHSDSAMDRRASAMVGHLGLARAWPPKLEHIFDPDL